MTTFGACNELSLTSGILKEKTWNFLSTNL